VPCQECRVDARRRQPALRLELTCDDEPLVHRVQSWNQEFDGD
jgi:hypothetical protein